MRQKSVFYPTPKLKESPLVTNLKLSNAGSPYQYKKDTLKKSGLSIISSKPNSSSELRQM